MRNQHHSETDLNQDHKSPSTDWFKSKS